jgi:hypothetical protein
MIKVNVNNTRFTRMALKTIEIEQAIYIPTNVPWPLDELVCFLKNFNKYNDHVQAELVAYSFGQ